MARKSAAPGGDSPDSESGPKSREKVVFKGGTFVISSKGESVKAHLEASAQASSGRGYLLYYGPEVEERHEESLREFLRKASGQEWELVDACLLHRRWDELSSGERERLARREGFGVVTSLPFLER